MHNVIIFPLFIIILQGLLRFLVDLDFGTVGISISALGIGQLMPYLLNENIVLFKLTGVTIVDEEYIISPSRFRVDLRDISISKSFAYIIVVICIVLLSPTIYCFSEGYITLSISIGALNWLLSFLYSMYG